MTVPKSFIKSISTCSPEWFGRSLSNATHRINLSLSTAAVNACYRLRKEEDKSRIRPEQSERTMWRRVDGVWLKGKKSAVRSSPWLLLGETRLLLPLLSLLLISLFILLIILGLRLLCKIVLRIRNTHTHAKSELTTLLELWILIHDPECPQLWSNKGRISLKMSMNLLKIRF